MSARPAGPLPPPGPPGDPLAVAPLTEQHWPEVREIYGLGIATGHATFEREPPTWERFAAGRPAEHRHVALATAPGRTPPGRGAGGVDAAASGAGPAAGGAGRVVGWVAAVPVSDRCVYGGVVELSVFVHPEARGRGVGRQLLDALVRSTEAAGVWTLQAGVFPENTASLTLHAAAGFRRVGVRERLGRMTHGPLAGQWRDVVLLERRSDRVGT